MSRYVTKKGGALGTREVIWDQVTDQPIAEFYGGEWYALAVALAALNEDAREAER